MPKFHHEIFFISILTSINKIKTSTKNKTFDQFLKDSDLFDSTLRRLQVIGDSVKNLLATDFLEKQDQAWKDIIAFRNLVVHEYFSLDPEIIFRIVSDEIEKLEKDVLRFIKQVENKTYLMQALSDTKKVLSKMNRNNEIIYLENIEKNLI